MAARSRPAPVTPPSPPGPPAEPERDVVLQARSVTLVVQHMTMVVNPAVTLSPTIDARPGPVTVNVPQGAAPVVHVTVPEQQPPTVNVTVPEGPAPTVTVNVPEQVPPAITFAPSVDLTPTFTVPQAPAPAVTVEVRPRSGSRTVTFERAADGTPTAATITTTNAEE